MTPPAPLPDRLLALGARRAAAHPPHGPLEPFRRREAAKVNPFQLLGMGALLRAAVHPALAELLPAAYGPRDAASRAPSPKSLMKPSSIEWSAYVFETASFLFLCEACADARPGRRPPASWSRLPKPEARLSTAISTDGFAAFFMGGDPATDETLAFFESFAIGLGSAAPSILAELAEQTPSIAALIEASRIAEAAADPGSARACARL